MCVCVCLFSCVLCDLGTCGCEIRAYELCGSHPWLRHIIYLHVNNTLPHSKTSMEYFCLKAPGYM